MKKVTINRGKYLHFYNAPNFGLSIANKNLSSKEENFVTFAVGDDSNYQFASIVIGRKEALETLKKFRKVLVKSRQKA